MAPTEHPILNQIFPPVVGLIPSADTSDLQRQIHTLHNSLSALADFAYVFDRAGRFLYANKPLLDLWGLSLEQAVGKNFFDLKYPHDLATRLQQQIEHVFKTGQRLVDETSYTGPSGVGGYYEYIFSPVLGAGGKIEAVAGTTRDITERKRAEGLIESQRRSLEYVASGRPLSEILAFLTAIVEEQAGGNVIASILLLDGEGKLRIGAAPSLPHDYNQAIDGLTACADLGTCSAAAATAQVVLTPDIDADPKWHSIKHLPAALGLKAAWSRPILARDGRVLGTLGTYFRECRAPSAQEQRVVEILARTAGIAIERARTDEERERLLKSERDARAEADAANRAKDHFLAMLSHELRTPLSPVVMTLPAMEADPDLPPKFQEDLAMMRRNIDLEVRLIDDLLDISRVTSGKMPLHMSRVHVHAILRHAAQISASEVCGKNTTIREEFAATDDAVTADPGRLQQVFWNLVRNALKFTPDGGTVTLRTGNESPGNRLVVEVQDTGIGIAPDLLPRIFDAFEQGDTRITRKFGGLGLGLAITKAVVQLHHATISAVSPGPGQGATFTVRF